MCNFSFCGFVNFFVYSAMLSLFGLEKSPEMFRLDYMFVIPVVQ